LSFGADILCLQEVDHYHDFLYHTLKGVGYEGVFKKRPKRVKKDGCAVFFRKDRFTIKDRCELSFNNLDGDLLADEDYSRFHTNNVALGLYLAEKHRPDVIGCGFWVITTHLFWDPNFEDVKLTQAKMLLRLVRKVVSQKRGGVILCGDFNSLPDSSVYKLFENFEDPSLGNESFDSICFLKSAYKTVTGREPSFTNLTGDFKGCLDYIWYSDEIFFPISVWNLPEERDLCAELQGSHEPPFLPNSLRSSDHLPLMAVFEWKNVVTCRYGIDCRRPRCRYSHPQLCRFGMRCTKLSSGTCRFFHVNPCKFGVSCSRPDCTFNHLACKFGSSCTNRNCVYSHTIPCRFGTQCMRLDCKYSHDFPGRTFAGDIMMSAPRPIPGAQDISTRSTFEGSKFPFFSV
jgi:hypothetical protein